MSYLEIIDNTAYRYTYDNVGNITKIEKGSRTTQNSSDVGAGNYTEVCSYVYDALGQLVRENNVVDNKTYVWNYDALGNIDSKLVYDYTTGAVSNPETGIDYQYTDDSKAGWKKLLTSIVYKTYSYTEEYPNGKSTVVSTETVNYDAIGNPTNYQGATVEWYGRQMTSYSKGDVSASFTYDADGLRGSKTVNGSKTTYFYVGDQLMYECRGDGIELYFYYDSYGNLSVIRYVNGTNSYYHYVTTNSQGDVLGIYSASDDLKASYEYDTWGNCTIVSDTSGINIATVNPIRYRGYYYDNDLGLYYLQSRYYDSTIGRFINADGYVTTNTTEPLTYNMFAYCGNNPVMYSDPSGYSGVLSTILVVLGYLVVDAIVTAIITNYVINLSNKLQIENEIEDTYTQEEAKETIEKTTGKDTVNFNSDTENVSIKDSYSITSRYERQKICMILSRTEGCKAREYDNLSAEWYGHNIVYYARLNLGSVIPWDLQKTGTVNLDYVRDDDLEFVIMTKVLEVLGMD